MPMSHKWTIWMGTTKKAVRACLDPASLALAAPRDRVIVVDGWGVAVVVGLKPLHELNVVQRARLHQLVHLDGLHTSRASSFDRPTYLVYSFSLAPSASLHLLQGSAGSPAITDWPHVGDAC